MGHLELPYYSDKSAVLAEIFGADRVEVERSSVVVDGVRFPVVDDVIVLLQADRYTKHVTDSSGSQVFSKSETNTPFAADIQYTFGEEWQAHPQILGEHEGEFLDYFDLIDIDALRHAAVCDLGCGAGRWSYYLRRRCKQLILVDYSDAIFVARKNLRDCPSALFFMADLTSLPFRSGFADLVICLGVLHHLPTPALDAVRSLKPHAPRILAYLYYALDNRPFYFRLLLAPVSAVRSLTARIRGRRRRDAISWLLTLGVYMPIVAAGRLANVVGLGRYVPLYETYGSKSLPRMRQDVYDRFFTRIEQRVDRASILGLRDTFESVTVSPNLPYWHFLCESQIDVLASPQSGEVGARSAPGGESQSSGAGRRG
jgi:SAM-dependent methyltransferase